VAPSLRRTAQWSPCAAVIYRSRAVSAEDAEKAPLGKRREQYQEDGLRGGLGTCKSRRRLPERVETKLAVRFGELSLALSFSEPRRWMNWTVVLVDCQRPRPRLPA